MATAPASAFPTAAPAVSTIANRVEAQATSLGGKKGVSTTHPQYDAFVPKWQKMRDVIAGQDAMQAAGERYLPRLRQEDDMRYGARVKRSDFFNATWRTIDALGGMAFRKSPTVEVPAAIEPFLADITLSGVSMEAFAKETTEEILGPGRVGILVDYPQVGDNVVPLTVAAAEARGLRPMLALYPAESIINWKTGRVNNAQQFTLVVLKEENPVPIDEFSHKTETQWRVLDLVEGFYRQRLFHKNAAGDDEQIGSDIFPTIRGQKIPYIPFCTVGANGKNDPIDEPPLADLANQNIAHYQINSDYRHGGHYTALPTLFLSGIQKDENNEKIYIGGDQAIVSPYENAKGSFIEYQGQGLGALEKMLDRKERQMAILGARMIADETSQVETLGATQIKRAGENSVLSKIIRAVGDALEWALGIFADWAGASGAVTYQINRDFLPAMMDALTLQAIFAGVQSGNISKREAFELLQRGDVIDGEVTYEEHQEQIDSEPSPAAPAVPPKADPNEPNEPAESEAA